MTTTQSETVTPPMLAKRWGVSVEKVYTFIRNGELRALDLRCGSERPRYRITLEEVRRFEESRSTRPPEPKTSRRTETEGREFF